MYRVKVSEGYREAEQFKSTVNIDMEFNHGLAVKHTLLESETGCFAIADSVHRHHGLLVVHEAEVEGICKEGLLVRSDQSFEVGGTEYLP